MVAGSYLMIGYGRRLRWWYWWVIGVIRVIRVIRDSPLNNFLDTDFPQIFVF